MEKYFIEINIFHSYDSPNLWKIQVKIRDSVIQEKTILSFIDVESFHPNQEICYEVNFVLISILVDGVTTILSFSIIIYYIFLTEIYLVEIFSSFDGEGNCPRLVLCE